MLVSLHKSYFYLLRAAKELDFILSGLVLEECYTQERDKLFLSIPSQVNSNSHLIISTNPKDYSLQIKDEHHKAKKNTISFFSSFFPQRICSVSIALGDRIIKINFERGSLFIMFRGGKSNCFYENNDGLILPFKKVEEQVLKSIQLDFSTMKWINNGNEIISRIELIQDSSELKSLQFVSKDLISLSMINEHFEKEKLISVINAIMNDHIAVGEDAEHLIAFFQPFISLPTDQELDVELFSNYFEAYSSYVSQNAKSHKEQDVRKDVERILGKELERVSGKLNNLRPRVENGSKELDHKRHGELLLNSLRHLTKGMKEISLHDWTRNEEVKIKLDPKLSPQQNVDLYFDKARAEKIDFEKSKEFYAAALDKFSKLQVIQKKLSGELSVEELNLLLKETRMDTKQTSAEDKKDKSPYRHFVIEGKYNFYIGKDSRNNDQLTTKFAKQNDFWFHARSVAGSHGVLRVDNTKENIPKKILEKAASITAFYSKAKSSKLASVTYTLKKYVTKNSRHEPGQVSVMKEQVILVRPEIPNDCEYQND